MDLCVVLLSRVLPLSHSESIANCRVGTGDPVLCVLSWHSWFGPGGFFVQTEVHTFDPVGVVAESRHFKEQRITIHGDNGLVPLNADFSQMVGRASRNQPKREGRRIESGHADPPSEVFYDGREYHYDALRAYDLKLFFSPSRHTGKERDTESGNDYFGQGTTAAAWADSCPRIGR